MSRGIQLNSAAVNAEKARRAAIIQSEEKKLMKYEDDRRRRYLKLQRINQGGALGQNRQTQAATTSQQQALYQSMPPPPPFAQSQSLGASSSRQSGRQGPPPSENEVQAAYIWLSSLRPLTLGGRIKREYLWRAVPDETDFNRKASSPYANSYLLQWFEPSSQQQPAGSIVLAETKDISIVNSQAGAAAGANALSASGSLSNKPSVSVVIVVGDSAKSIRGTGGRTTVVIECSSANEAMQYRNTLTTLRTASILQSQA
jgi:hypothetical protein